MTDIDYPEPSELREYAMEPMPFHPLTPDDLSMQIDGHLEATIVNVTYNYRPATLAFELESIEWTPQSDISDLFHDHDRSWKQADNVEITEDYIAATGLTHAVEWDHVIGGKMDKPVQFDAKWLLDEVTIKNDD